MPIHVPGHRARSGRMKKPKKRNAVAVLSLTAMVDMFTVLTVFLLQNYATTGEVIFIPKEVKLPQAHTVKELKPSNVVVISPERIMVNNEVVADFQTVKEQQDWDVPALKERVVALIDEGKKEEATLGSRVRKAMTDAKGAEVPEEDEVPQYMKITIQADKGVDFLTVKKIMYTVTEAGIAEINFAVIKLPDDSKVPGG
ncbi:MAG: biopolymer transporter ExbD [Bdellovibrionales bacterium]|nr:biopolymer transporter ExbD [Bdellovibrionales bacterium]